MQTPGRAPPRAVAAQPVRLLDLPGELMGFELGPQPVRQGGDPPRHRGARRGASRVLRARDRGAPGGRLRGGPHRGRQRDGPADRHDAELGLRARVRASGRGARDVRAPLHEVPPGRLPRGEPGRGLDDRAALGARRDRRRAAPARVHARRVPMDDPRGPRPRRGPPVRRAGRAVPVEDDRLGVQRLPQGPATRSCPRPTTGSSRPSSRRAGGTPGRSSSSRSSGRPAGMRSSARSRTTTTAVRCSTPCGTWGPRCSRRRRTSRR